MLPWDVAWLLCLLKPVSYTHLDVYKRQEWIHFHPLKKLLIFGLWGVGVVLVLRGILVTAIGKIEMDGELFLFLLGTAVLVVLHTRTAVPSVP